jgi:uncharacterized protein YdcH (DUF465 family)
MKMYENRIRHLEEMHSMLDKQIRGLESTGRFDDVTMQTFKKQKLSLKDQISELRRKQWEHDHESVEQDDE